MLGWTGRLAVARTAARLWVCPPLPCPPGLQGTPGPAAAARLLQRYIRTISPHRGSKSAAGAGPAAVTPTPSVEETYTRLSAVDHVLLRPGMYIGSTDRVRCGPHLVR